MMVKKKAIFFAYEGDGSENYPLLKWAGSDAVSMRKVFDDIGFQCCDLSITLNPVNSARVKELIRDCTSNLVRGDLLVMYFAGHGIGIGEKDVLLLVGKNQYIRLIDIVDKILQGAYDAVIFLDCCRSKDAHKIGDSSLATDSGASKIVMDRPRNFLPMNADSSRYESDYAMQHDNNGARIVFYACQDGENASDGSMNDGHSPFARSLREELKSSKKRLHDTLPDRELLKRIQKKVRQINVRQKPDRQEFPEGKEYPVLVKGSMRKPLYGAALLAISCAASWLFSVCPTETEPDMRSPQKQYEMALALQERPLFKARNKANAVKWLQSAADGDVADAQVALGEMYEDGCCGLDVDKVMALELYQRAAKQHHPKALAKIATFFIDGQAGLPVDWNAAFEYLYQSATATNGLDAAQVLVGKAYHTGDIHGEIDFNKAHHFYSLAAAKGNADAMYNLYWLYNEGADNFPSNHDTAVSWLEQAADAGHTQSMSKYAVMLLEGSPNVRRDRERGLRFLQDAANKGDPYAQCNLASIYAYGKEGVAQDEKLAIALWLKAAEQGNIDAQRALGWAYGTATGTVVDDEKAFLYFHKAAEKGDAPAQAAVGMHYMQGRGIYRDCCKAAEWFEKAAAQGNLVAQYKLAELYHEGNGVLHNEEKAAYWEEKAAKQGHAISQYNMGLRYKYGRGVEKSELLQIVENRGHATAVFYNRSGSWCSG